ncbi:hypothetical protein BJ138DRAFT_1117333 [Hygrophoropsis aurantiaca]|uniref:Uncharacterized protein n=1 Tax=Hygrophoropsis aurantiaca TaxID=72124 RepID=A0ACB8A045_9AGAM|nr:hypothetical protein BJ138DRAFT_1117333 [Hygrophoropsis aurantiaca]
MSNDDEDLSPQAILQLAQSGSQEQVDAYFADDNHGDALNETNPAGNTVLHFAAQHTWPATVDLLTTHDAGCDLDVQNLQRETPIAIAVRRLAECKVDESEDSEYAACRAVVRLLVLAGADLAGIETRVSPPIRDILREFERERDEEASDAEYEDAEEGSVHERRVAAAVFSSADVASVCRVFRFAGSFVSRFAASCVLLFLLADLTYSSRLLCCSSTASLAFLAYSITWHGSFFRCMALPVTLLPLTPLRTTPDDECPTGSGSDSE